MILEGGSEHLENFLIDSLGIFREKNVHKFSQMCKLSA
jgi:hypothetical protein